MPLDRFYRLPEDRRRKLLEVAGAEFAEKGFDAASLNTILAAAGLSKGSYYYYFVDKEDLYAETLAHALSGYLRSMPAPPTTAPTREDFWHQLADYFAQCSRVAEQAPEALLMLRSLDAARRQSPRFAALRERLSQIYVSVLQHGQALGCVRQDLPLALLVNLLLTVDAVLDEALLGLPAPPTPQELQRHMALVLNTFRRLLEPACASPEARSPS